MTFQVARDVSPRLRFTILHRDNHTCQYCGAQAPDVRLEVDHIVPLAQGGTNDPDNLLAACYGCNRGKGDALCAEDGTLTTNILASLARRTDDSGLPLAVKVPSLDASGNPIGVLMLRALMSAADYKLVIASLEKEAAKTVTKALAFIAEAEERYGYKHPVPPEVRAYINALAEDLTGTPLLKGLVQPKRKRGRKEKARKVQPEV